MILIDAIYVNTGGGKVLLNYLIEKLGKTDAIVLYLLDKRIEGKHKFGKPSDQIIYMKSTLLNRFIFYKKNRFKFNKVFCLGNIPPLIKLNCKTYTYFHNSIYLNIPDGFSYIQIFLYFLKISLLNILKENTNEWLVQSNFIKNKFHLKYNISINSIRVIPFFPPFSMKKTLVVRKKNTYVYVSNATPNKNHGRLIEAFCAFFNEYKKGELILTVGDEFKNILNIIKEKKRLGFPIINVGYMDRENLKNLYCSVEYLIFPSLEESFGLGIQEAIVNGCKIIGSDLPYLYEICIPSLVFDPMSVNSIVNAFEKSLFENVRESKSLVEDKVDLIIYELTNNI